jgi:hypothetical protein
MLLTVTFRLKSLPVELSLMRSARCDSRKRRILGASMASVWVFALDVL